MSTSGTTDEIGGVSSEGRFTPKSAEVGPEGTVYMGRSVKREADKESMSSHLLPSTSSEPTSRKFHARKHPPKDSSIPEDIHPGSSGDIGGISSKKRQHTGPKVASLTGRSVKRKTSKKSASLIPVLSTPSSLTSKKLRGKKLPQKDSPLPKEIHPGSDFSSPQIAFHAAKSASLSHSEFEHRVDTLLSASSKGPLQTGIIERCAQEGRQRVETLISEGNPFQAQKLAEKLLQFATETPHTSAIKLARLTSLRKTANRDTYVAYTKLLVKDPRLEENTKKALLGEAYDYCFKCKEFAAAIEFGNALLSLLPESEQEPVKKQIDEAKAALKEYSEINDAEENPSSIKGLSQEQLSFLTFVCKNPKSTLTPEQDNVRDLLLSFCIGNKKFSQTLRTLSTEPSFVEGFKELLPFMKNPARELTNVTRDFSILSAKTQQATLEKDLKAVGKLSTLLDKIELHKKSTPSHPTSGQASPQLKIEQSERLTFSDLKALNSFIDLKERLEILQQEGWLEDNPDVSSLIEQGTRAKQLVQKLVTILGEEYQTGDLSYENSYKRTGLGLSKGLMLETYGKLITPFGHAAIIDQTMDMEDISYSEVLGEHTYRPVPLEDFLITDVYRFNASRLISKEGRALLEARIKKLQEIGQVPQIPLDKYVQEIFIDNLETILAGPETSEVLVDELELPPPPSKEVVAEAEKALLESKKTLLEAEKKVPSDIVDSLEKAQIDLEDAEEELQKYQEELSKAKEDLQEKLDQGLDESSDSVVSAREFLSEAEENVELTQAEVDEAQKQVEKAQKLLDKAKEKCGVTACRNAVVNLSQQLINHLQAIHTAAVVEEQRLRRVLEYHTQTFGNIENTGKLQDEAGIRDLHNRGNKSIPKFAFSLANSLNFLLGPFGVPEVDTSRLSPKSAGLDVENISFNTNMICSQFQALATLKALDQTKTTLEEMIAEEMATKDMSADEMVVDVPVSKKPTDSLVTSALKPKTPEQQRIYDTALAEVKAKKLILLPIPDTEHPEMLTPRRVTEYFASFFTPVPMAPIAREILDLPEQFFGTALFGSTPEKSEPPEEPDPMEESK